MPVSRWTTAPLAALVALPCALAGCNEIFGVNDFVVVETGGGGAGGAPSSSPGTGGAPCGAECTEAECCDGACVDLAGDETNCGVCGKTCPGTVCFGGECSTTCVAPFEDCDKNLALNGCEANLTTDVASCGSCGIACPAGASCAGGACACSEGLVDCDGNPVNGCETDTQTSASSCGGCGQSCGPGQVCTAGACVCSPELEDCNLDPNDGCEASLASREHCGQCGDACGPHMVCSAGGCACAPGFLDCTADAGCESQAASPSSCGMCGVVCLGADVCDGTACVAECLAGQTQCGGSCVDVMTSPLHCGACDAAVGPSQLCAGGVPTCTPGHADCTADPGCETDTTDDRASCGGCGIVCKPGAVCVLGACACALATPNDCGAECLACCSNADCGDGLGCTADTCAPDGLSCDHAACAAGTQCCSQIACAECCADTDCAPDESCSGGICSVACPVGSTLCNGECVDTQEDPNHCNGCNLKCGGDGTCACTGGACSGGTVYFSEDFSDNFKGWTLGTEWAIGPAVQGSGQQAGNPDPAMDHSASSDNGIAGVVIGGNYSTSMHAFYHLQSPVIDLSAAAGPVKLTFFRWLNGGMSSGTAKVVHKVEISNGGGFATLWETNAVVADAAWAKQEIDVTAHKGATVRIRFSFRITGGSGSISSMSGFNVDDVTLSSGACN